jgi:hypothetical protein
MRPKESRVGRGGNTGQWGPERRSGNGFEAGNRFGPGVTEYRGTPRLTGPIRALDLLGGGLVEEIAADAHTAVQTGRVVGRAVNRIAYTTGRVAHYAMRPIISAGNLVVRTADRAVARAADLTGTGRNTRAVESNLPTYRFEDNGETREIIGSVMRKWNGTWKGTTAEDVRTALVAVGMQSERIISQIGYGIEVGTPSNDLGGQENQFVIRNSKIVVSEVLPIYLDRLTSSIEHVDSPPDPRLAELERLTGIIDTTRVELIRRSAFERRHELAVEIDHAEDRASRIDYHMRRITAVTAALTDLDTLYPS